MTQNSTGSPNYSELC